MYDAVLLLKTGSMMHLFYVYVQQYTTLTWLSLRDGTSLSVYFKDDMFHTAPQCNFLKTSVFFWFRDNAQGCSCLENRNVPLVYNADKQQSVICIDICINASDLPPIYMSKCG